MQASNGSTLELPDRSSWPYGWAAVLVFMVLAPVAAPLSSLSPNDFARMAALVVTALCTVELVQSALFAPDALRPGGKATVLVVGMLGAASVAHAAHPGMALRELAHLAGLGAVAVVFSRSGAKNAPEVQTTAVLFAMLLFAALPLTLLAGALLGGTRLSAMDAAPAFNNMRFFNHVQTVALPLLALATGPSFRGGSLARLAWIALALNFALLFFTQGRATGVALLGAALIALVVVGRKSATVLWRLTIAAALGLAVYFALFEALPVVMHSPEGVPQRGIAQSSYDERVQLWRLAAEQVQESPWWGIGPMHYAHRPNQIAAHPHSVYLQIASEWGLPMLLGVLALAAMGLSCMVGALARCTEPAQQAVGVALLVALLGAGIDGAFSGNFVMPISQVWIAVVIGWAVAWTQQQNLRIAQSTPPPLGQQWFPSKRRQSLRLVRSTFVVILLGLQAYLWWSLWPEIADLPAHLEQLRNGVTKSETVVPRFWSNGSF